MFLGKTGNNFLNSEQKIIEAENRVHNFINNAKQNNFMQNARNGLCRKQRTIFMKKQWTILLNAKKRFYECTKQIWIYNKYDMQRETFFNLETDFINVEK